MEAPWRDDTEQARRLVSVTGDDTHWLLVMVRIPTHAPPTHPGEMLLEEFLNPLNITQTDAAARLGISYVRLNQIINVRRGVTPDTALRLERLFGMEAQFWLNLQLAWDLYNAMHAPEAAEIKKIKPLPEPTGAVR